MHKLGISFRVRGGGSFLTGKTALILIEWHYVVAQLKAAIRSAAFSPAMMGI